PHCTRILVVGKMTTVDAEPLWRASVRFRLNWLRRSPGSVTTGEGHGLEAEGAQLPRHTGAGGFARSGAVGDDGALLVSRAGPFAHLIGEYAHAPRDLSRVLVVLAPCAHVQHDRGRVARQQRRQFVWRDAWRVVGVWREQSFRRSL